MFKFEPKSREDILLDFAKSNSPNKQFMIDVYEKHPDKFNKIFDLLCIVPSINIPSLLSLVKSRTELISFNTKEQALAAIKILNLCGINGRFGIITKQRIDWNNENSGPVYTLTHNFTKPIK